MMSFERFFIIYIYSTPVSRISVGVARTVNVGIALAEDLVARIDDADMREGTG
jgi:hypothetical protein